MIPAYFPFSTLSEASAEILFGFFETLALYRPRVIPLPEGLAPWLTAGRLCQRAPAGVDPKRLARALSACRQWAEERDLGSGGWGAFLKAQPAGIPFHDAEAVGRLRSQILGQERRETTNSDHSADAPYFDASLFLAMAEAYDTDSENAATQLMHLQSVEEEALREMHGGEDPGARIGPPAAAIAAAEDRGAFMTGQRLRAWAILVSQEPELAPVLITDSPAVATELMEYGPGMACLDVDPPGGDDGARAVFRDHLRTWLDEVARASAPEPLFSAAAVELPIRAGASPVPRVGGPFVRLHLMAECPPGRLLGKILPDGVAPRWRAAEGGRHGVIAVLHT
jgi:hypothetical protein